MSLKMPEMPEQEESQSMSAMTDVVFLLLIFFIVTMSAFVETTLLEANLPTNSSKASSPDLANTVRIDIPQSDNSRYYYLINGTPHTVSELNQLLSRYRRLMPNAEFLIKCSPLSEHHQLVTLLADCSRHNLKNLKLLKTN